MTTTGQECHPVGRKMKKRSAPHHNRRQMTVRPNDPRNDQKKTPRMGEKRRDGMIEERKPPPKRGRESHEESVERPRDEDQEHGRNGQGQGPLRLGPDGSQHSPPARRMSPQGHRCPP